MVHLLIAFTAFGCATPIAVGEIGDRLSVTRKRVEETRYYLKVESCRSSHIVCRLDADDVNEELGCLVSLESCLVKALEEYRSDYYDDPQPLHKGPKY